MEKLQCEKCGFSMPLSDSDANKIRRDFVLCSDCHNDKNYIETKAAGRVPTVFIKPMTFSKEMKQF